MAIRPPRVNIPGFPGSAPINPDGSPVVSQPGAPPPDQPSAYDRAVAAIANTDDIGQILRYFRSGPGSGEAGQYGSRALDVSNLAKDKLVQLTGIDANIISSMHDAEIIQSYQGNIEKRKIEELAKEQQGKINEFADEFSGKAKTFRQQLAESLAKNNREAFELQNPYILEDLNSRGLFRSETAVNQAQAEALKELEIGRENSLLQFDTGAFGQEQDLRGGGLSHLIGGEMEGLTTALDARRSGLEMSYNQSMAAQEQALAESLARRKRRSDLTNSLIGAGGSIIGGFMGRR